MTTTEDDIVAPEKRGRNPKATKADILRVATAEFAANGFAGARVDEIAAETATTKRMIYYYFGSKEGLYLEVMESAYERVRGLERELDVVGLDPVQSLRHLAELTYDHHTSHRDFVRLVQIENIHRAEHISESTRIQELNSRAIETLSGIIARGVSEGLFRDDIDALDAHMIISSYAIFHVANRYTFRTVFGRDLLEDKRHDRYRKLAGDIIVATLRLE